MKILKYWSSQIVKTFNAKVSVTPRASTGSKRSNSRMLPEAPVDFVRMRRTSLIISCIDQTQRVHCQPNSRHGRHFVVISVWLPGWLRGKGGHVTTRQVRGWVRRELQDVDLIGVLYFSALLSNVLDGHRVSPPLELLHVFRHYASTGICEVQHSMINNSGLNGRGHIYVYSNILEKNFVLR